MMPPFDRSSLNALFVCGCLGVALGSAGVASAQSHADASATRTWIGPGGLGRYERDQWSTVTVTASNSGDSDADASVSVFLENDPRIQFTRRFWLPAHSSRKTWLPIRPPANITSAFPD